MADKRGNVNKKSRTAEYPWSSDEEDNGSPVHLASMLRMRDHAQSTSSSQPQQSTSNPGGVAPEPNVQSLTQVKKPEVTKRDRNLFWSLLTNPSNGQLDIISRSRGASEGQQREASRTTKASRRPAATRRSSSPLREIRDLLAMNKEVCGMNQSRSRSSFKLRVKVGASRTMPTKNPLFTSTAAGHGKVNRRAATAARQDARAAPVEPWTPLTYEAVRAPPKRSRTATSSRPAPANTPVDVQPSTSSGAGAGGPLTIGGTFRAGQDMTIVTDSDEADINSPRPKTDSEQSAEVISVNSTVTIDSLNASAIVSLEEESLEVLVPEEQSTSADQPDGNQPRGDPLQNPEERPVLLAEDDASRGVKRKIDGDGDEHIKKFNQSLLRLLECPVCLEWMAPPMSQCRRGHLVCVSCRSRLSACPVCRSPFSSVRNRAMESVAEVLHYPCRHGCGLEVRLRRRNAHEASCPRRRYPCPAPACAARAPLEHALLEKHLQAKHLPMLKLGKKHRFNIRVNADQHENWIIMALRELFHLRIDVDLHTWGFTIYVAYIGPKNSAKTYTYEVSIAGKQNGRTLRYTRDTHSDLESASVNASRQDCFHLSLDQALNFLRLKDRDGEPENSLSVSVAISKNETEADVEEDSCSS